MHVQRWRLTYTRGPDAPDLAQREQAAAWASALDSAGLSGRDDPEPAKLVQAAAIPVGLTSDAELADLFLAARRTAADVRAALSGAMPAGHRLVDLHDVWLGEPALPGALAAADYRVTLVADDGPPPERASLVAAVDRLMSAATIERVRAKATASATAANLRPLIEDIRVLPDASLWMRLRFDPNLGTGRPDEVVSALGTLLGQPLRAATRHRERLWLRGDERAAAPS